MKLLGFMGRFLKVLVVLLITFPAFAQTGLRRDILLNSGWTTIQRADSNVFAGFESPHYTTHGWKKVTVPHNWDAYEGYRRMRHGNLHGYAWYRKTFTAAQVKPGERFFLWFEGAGSYATVWLNGKQVGYHAGGRTSFTIDITGSILPGNKPNLLAVRIGHPANIQDLPWVCGGCSEERGFSEGSQPMGIFRPVHLVVTNSLRIAPFGAHIWNDSTTSAASARLELETEVGNYGATPRIFSLVNRLVDHKGNTLARSMSRQEIKPGQTRAIRQEAMQVIHPRLWSLEDPYLYQVISEIVENGKVIDRLSTSYGIRWISWPAGRAAGGKQFFLNGKPVFINGIAEYEHLFGQSHAFSAEQVRSRVMQIRASGFNAFRDAHQPHSLRYQAYWDELGILWWPQMAAHIWYDTPAFRKNFKQLLTDWVKERRNSPSVVLWGLENESTLPEDFARECTELIRRLDPTASSQRKVTTCNGGKGTDWDVPQNWTGTYGGNPADYADDVKRQVLIGEYGAWRTADLHTEGPFNSNGPLSEDRMSQLMEQKIRLAESVRDSTSGHFFWLFTSHDNPGRVQGGEGLRELDRIGPVNYKGLLTPWEEPLDVFYLFRSNYAPKEREPMVYIVSHTWPDRWIAPGIKDSISVYANCDEVELFNDVGAVSLGRKKRGGRGTHFQWDRVNIRYNVLVAVGYVNGKEVARDMIVLNHLPQAPHLNDLRQNAPPVTAPEPGYHYLYRVNCGGPEYLDKNGNTWMADRQQTGKNTWGSHSWTEDFKGLQPLFASQRRTRDPIRGTADWPLFQDFRYGLDKLSYEFPVPDGDYRVELYFTEPWLGTGGGMDCTGWRLFDVAVNGNTLLKDVDIWKASGHDGALKKVINTTVKGGRLIIHFPRIAAGQAILSAVAIATRNSQAKAAKGAETLVSNLLINGKPASSAVKTWLDTGDQPYNGQPVQFSALPSALYGGEWIQTHAGVQTMQFSISAEADVFVGIDPQITPRPQWLEPYENTGTFIRTDRPGESRLSVYRKRYAVGTTITLGSNPVAGSHFQPYTVAVLPASSIEPAYDLKSVQTYRAIDARLQGTGAVKEPLMDKERVIFKRPSGDQLTWTIQTGVADIYSLTIKYHNPTDKPLQAKISVSAADGTLLKKDELITLVPTKPGKWNYFTTNTGTMINAGTYHIVLTATNAQALTVDALDVQ